MVFNYRGGRLVLRKPVNLGKNSYFSSQATNFGLKSFTRVHSLIQKGARRVERSTFPGVCILFRSCHCEWIVSVFGVTLVALATRTAPELAKLASLSSCCFNSNQLITVHCRSCKQLLQFKATSDLVPRVGGCVLGYLTTLPSIVINFLHALFLWRFGHG